MYLKIIRFSVNGDSYVELLGMIADDKKNYKPAYLTL